MVYPAWCEDDFTTTPLDDDNTNTPVTSIRGVSLPWQPETLQWQLRTLVIRKSPANNPMHRSRERESSVEIFSRNPEPEVLTVLQFHADLLHEKLTRIQQ